MDLLPFSVNKLEKKIGKTFSYYQSKLPKLGNIQRKASKEAIGIISSNLRTLSRFLGTNRYEKADDFFFKFESLPPFGKEYWFMYFVDDSSKRQLVVTFGRPSSGMEINKVKLKGGNSKIESDCAAVVWYFDGKKKVVIDSRAKSLLFSSDAENSLSFSNRKHDFSIEGKYPQYDLALEENGKSRISLEINRSKRGKPYEIINFLAANNGYGFVNLYFKFKGMLYGKPFSGNCYLQKVILTSPFIPWNWGRFYFKDGNVFEFFALYTPIIPAKIKLWTQAKYVDMKNGRTLQFPDFNIEKTKDGSRWHIFGKEYSLFAKAYSSHPFTFRGFGKFKYLEYFAETVDFTIRGKERGKGTGIIEDAFGFVV
ncbi:MAG: hypothetical protein ABIG96_01520 [Candidatus Micrarchaeota archaeon]